MPSAGIHFGPVLFWSAQSQWNKCLHPRKSDRAAFVRTDPVSVIVCFLIAGTNNQREAEMGRFNRYLLALAVLIFFVPFAQAQELDGTWKLVMRKLPNGTTVKPPAVLGAYTIYHGLQNLNVFWQTPEGKAASYARVSTYKMTDTDYSETALFIAFDDGSGKPPTYNLTGNTETKPVTRQGSRIAFQQPFGEPSAVFEGDTFTATLEGQFVDYWERVH
jgi:hypothetical protein